MLFTVYRRYGLALGEALGTYEAETGVEADQKYAREHGLVVSPNGNILGPLGWSETAIIGLPAN